MQTRSHSRRFGTLVAVLALAGCGVQDDPGPAGQEPPLSAVQAGYAPPPELLSAVRRGGAVVLGGRASPGAGVRLQSPDGLDIRVSADAEGAWSATVQNLAEPRMFAFTSSTDDGRIVRGEGPLLVLPAPGPPGLMLRAGFGALAPSQAEPTPRILALDYDEAGGAAVAGLAQAGSPVEFSFDGAAAGVGQADAFGRFSVVAANRPLNAGARRIMVETSERRLEEDVRVSPPQPLPAPYRVRREPGAWRVDWTPPGGGVQTTVVFDAEDGP